MTSDVMWAFIYQSGGRVVAPDGTPALNSPETAAALEFLKEMHEYVPTGANNYDFGDVINAYVSGVAATTMYTGRVFANVANQNPAIADQVSVAPYPHRKDGIAWYGNDFEGHVIPKNAKNVEAAKRFAQFTFQKEQYIKFLHTAPRHQNPPQKSVRESQEFLSHPLLVKYKPELATLFDILSKSNCAAKPFANEPFIAKAGEIGGANVLSEMLQRVVVNGESPADAAAWGHDQVGKILQG
jgi:multiple sugar transport system substrate-binding protein